MKSSNQVVYENAWKWACKELEKIEVVDGNYHGGHNCHHVAFNNAFRFSNPVVVALMFVPKSGVRVHFINIQKKRYVDHTLGYLSRYNTFFKLAEFDWGELEDYHRPAGADNLLMEFKHNILNLLFTEEEQKGLSVGVENL